MRCAGRRQPYSGCRSEYRPSEAAKSGEAIEGAHPRSAVLLRLWKPPVPPALERAISGFVHANAAYWAVTQGASRHLVEGHLSQYGPNYLLRTAVAARRYRKNRLTSRLCLPA